MIPDETSFLRSTERDLYSVDGITPQPRSFLHNKKLTTPDTWEHESHEPSHTPPPMKTNPSIFKKIFFGSLVFLGVAIIAVGLSSLSGTNAISSQKIDITITAKTFVDGGEDLPVAVTITNRNKIDLELAMLVLEYPEGSTENPGSMVRLTRDIGTIPVGGTHNEALNVKLYGEENSIKNITARIEFRVTGSNVVYDAQQETQVTIRTSPVRLTLDAPLAAIPNQEIPLTITVTGNSAELLKNTALVLEYPPGFTFLRSTPEPTVDTNVWYLGDINPGAVKKITLVGSLTGSLNDAKTIRASIGSQSRTNEKTLDTTYNTLAQVIPLSNAFLDARFVVNQSDQGAVVAINAGQTVSVSVPWENTLAAQLTNVQIEVAFSGAGYDPAKIQPGAGFFDSLNNKIIWSPQQVPSFASLGPGASGNLSFSLQPKQITSGQTVNPTINMAISISGFDTTGKKQEAKNIDKKTLAIGSDINFTGRTLYYSGPLTHQGTMPPVANQETTYTLEWRLTNSRNRVTGVTVSTVLPTYVQWKNVVSPGSEQSAVTYNEVTRELIWNAGEVPAGTGTSLPARTVFLKVGITPSLSQKGTVPKLTDTITIKGLDTFTQKPIELNRRELETRLTNDGFGSGYDGIVN